MYVLHIIPGDLWAGAEAQVFYTLREIRRRSSVNIGVILFNKGELYYRLADMNIEVVILDENKYSSLSICCGVNKILMKKKPDIVHVHEYKSHILAVAAKYMSGSKCKILRTVHGRSLVAFNWRYLKSHVVLSIEDIVLRYFSPNIVAVSKDLEGSLSERYRRATVYQISNGVSTTFGCLVSREEIKRRFNVEADRFCIGTAARLESIKNLEMLIEAARLLEEKKEGINYCICIFGDGDLREELERKVAEYELEDKVALYGHHQDMVAIMRAFDVFVLTSRDEGLPISLLEAMSMGAVPVCTRVGGLKEVIEHGQDGFLVELDNARELAGTLAYIYKNREEMQRIRKNAFSKVVRDYSIEGCAEKLVKLYGSL